MKKIFFLLLLTAVLLPGTILSGNHVFAQQDVVSCIEDGLGTATLKQYATNLYYWENKDNSYGSKEWFWLSQHRYFQQYFSYGAGAFMGTWQCSNGKLTTTTEKIPECLLNLPTPLRFVGSDPDGFVYTDTSLGGTVGLRLSNHAYKLPSGKIGTWQCDGTKIVLGAATTTTNGNSTNNTNNTNNTTQTNNTDQNTSSGTPDNNQNTSSGAKNTPPGSGTENTDGVLKIKLVNPLCSNPNDPTKKCTNDIQDAIKLFMDAVVKIAIPFIVVFFIWSGLQFILARGNPTKISTAKKMFWYTIIGTLLILGAWAITDAIVGTINSIAS